MPDQFSTLMLACATILPNFSVSAATNSRYCPGVMTRGTMPCASSVSEIALSRRPLTTISLRRRDDRTWRGGGRKQPEPVEELVALELDRCLGERGRVGQLRHALARGDGDGAQPAILDQRQRGGET